MSIAGADRTSRNVRLGSRVEQKPACAACAVMASVGGGTLCATEQHCRLLRSILTTELADAAVIAIAGNPALKGFYTRTLHFRPHAAVAYPRFGYQPRPGQRHSASIVDLRAV
jgi:hypothetical protein